MKKVKRYTAILLLAMTCFGCTPMVNLMNQVTNQADNDQIRPGYYCLSAVSGFTKFFGSIKYLNGTYGEGKMPFIQKMRELYGIVFSTADVSIEQLDDYQSENGASESRDKKIAYLRYTGRLSVREVVY